MHVKRRTHLDGNTKAKRNLWLGFVKILRKILYGRMANLSLERPDLGICSNFRVSLLRPVVLIFRGTTSLHHFFFF